MAACCSARSATVFSAACMCNGIGNHHRNSSMLATHQAGSCSVDIQELQVFPAKRAGMLAGGVGPHLLCVSFK